MHVVPHFAGNSLLYAAHKPVKCGTIVGQRRRETALYNEKEQIMSDTTTRPEGATGEGTTDSPWFPEVYAQLSGNDGNAFAIMGNVARELRSAGVPREAIDRYREESMSGDYDNLLQTAMRWVEVG